MATLPAGTSVNSRRPLGGNQLNAEDIMDHGGASGDILRHDEGLGDILEPRRTSTSCQDQGRRYGHHLRLPSSRSNRDIKEQETGVELFSKLVADRQLRQDGRQGQLYGFESTALWLCYRQSALSMGTPSK